MLEEKRRQLEFKEVESLIYSFKVGVLAKTFWQNFWGHRARDGGLFPWAIVVFLGDDGARDSGAVP